MTDRKSEKDQKPGRKPQNRPKPPFSSEWIASESLLTVFASLWKRQKEQGGQVDGLVLGQALQRLLRAETAPGGPYIDASGVVDPLANAAITLFLHEQGVYLPALEPFVAQFEPAKLKKRLNAAAVSHAVATIRAKLPRLTAGHEALLDSINTHVRTDMAAWPEPLATTGGRVFATLLRADKAGEIRLMPQLLANSLIVQPKIGDDRLVLLGAANAFFWIGGMLFDDFLDEEGKPELLPIATAAHRQALALYRRVTADKPELYEYIEASCLQADRANAWEVTHTRAPVTRGMIKLPELPEYDDFRALADRSIGHLFGPLLIIRQLPGISDSQRARVEQGLRHYLIARQLNDDIHDWRKDLRVGQLSVVVTELLRGVDIRPGNHRLTTLVPLVERHFMEAGLERTCGLLQEHVALARESLAMSGLTANTGGITDLITRQELTMHAALETNNNYRKFLATFATE